MGLRAAFALLLSCSLSCPVAGAAVAEGLYEGTAHDALYGLCLEGSHGIAVGAYGLVVESLDGGQTWQQRAPFTETALLDVTCGEGPGLIVGQQGHIFRLEDQQYEAVESGTDARLLGVDSNADGLAVAVGGFGTVLRSADGGRTWEALGFDWEAILNDFLEPHLYAVDVSPEGVITIVGEFELVLRSLDGGNSWDTVHQGEASLFSLDLRADGQGYAVGQKGRIIRTGDGGSSWSTLATPDEANLLDVWSGAGGDVLVSGIRTMLRSRDGGDSWESVAGGDLNTGWYQQLAVPAGEQMDTGYALLAGHRGRIISLNFE